MFSLFRSAPGLPPLESGTAKIVRVVKTHMYTLALKRRAGITIDSYGKVDATRWNAEVQYFIDKVVLPELTDAERLAIGKSGLSRVANDLIEAPVRAECNRLHVAGLVDMTVPVVDSVSDWAGKTLQTKLDTRISETAGSGVTPSRGLIIRAEPLEKILSGKKTWEMRSAHTKVRGPIALIQKGSKAVYGVAQLTDSRGALNREEMLRTIHLHGITADRIDNDEIKGYRYAWVLERVRRLPRPIPYQHIGGVTFVTLDPYAVEQIRVAIGE